MLGSGLRYGISSTVSTFDCEGGRLRMRAVDTSSLDAALGKARISPHRVAYVCK